MGSPARRPSGVAPTLEPSGTLAEMFEVEDLVAAVMDATVSAGGRVFQIGVASPLDVSGIGALTRFPVSA